MGLGKSVMFLNQDPSPFIADLYNASDIIVSLRKVDSDRLGAYPRFIAEAMACGVVPLVPKGGVEEEIAAGSGCSVIDDSPTNIAREVARMLLDESSFESQRTAAAMIASTNYPSTIAADRFSKLITFLIESSQSLSESISPKEIVGNIERRMRDGSVDDALVLVEDHLLRAAGSQQFKAELLRVKGDILVTQSRLEVAMQSYESCVNTDDRNHWGYFGLGQVAFLSHSNEDAMIFFRKALAKCPNHPESLLGIGLVHQRIGLVDEALYWLNRCLVFQNHNHRAMTALTQACLESKNTIGGISVLEQLLDSVGETPSLMMALGQLYLREGRHEEGREIMAKVLKNSPQDRPD
jgi:tetratricopeptide (TPR) repeat protein